MLQLPGCNATVQSQGGPRFVRSSNHRRHSSTTVASLFPWASVLKPQYCDVHDVSA